MLSARMKFDLHNIYVYIFTVWGCTGAQTTDTGSLALVL